jgi:hypothetical protein
MEPQVGNIYHPTTGVLLGVRDIGTLLFTPNGALSPEWAFVEDRFSTSTECIIATTGLSPSIGGDFTTEFTSEFL